MKPFLASTNIFLFISISLYFTACAPDNEVVFPDDGMYRYLILDKYSGGPSQIEVLYVHFYNLNLNNDSTIAKLISFAQHYHCKQMSDRNENFIGGNFYILSDVKDFTGPHYYDNDDWVTINKKIIYRIRTLYDSSSNTINASILKGIKGDDVISLDNIKGCDNTMRDTSVFVQLKGRGISWKGVHKQADKAWREYEER